KIQAFPFVREELFLITPKKHPLARKEAVSLGEIRPYPFIIREEGSATRGVVLAAFSKMNIAPSVLMEAKSTEFIKEWVSQGKGVSILIKVMGVVSLLIAPLIARFWL
ncbi:MAG: LysR substrate-binding domain-containing protein, partial [Bdellovibrionota bacterium]